MAKAKRRATLAKINNFEKTLREYLSPKSDVDFMLALRAMIANPNITRDDLKNTANGVEGANWEKLNEMRSEWAKINRQMTELSAAKKSFAPDEEERATLFEVGKNKIATLLAIANHDLTIFRLEARNLHLLPGVLSDQEINKLDGKNKSDRDYSVERLHEKMTVAQVRIDKLKNKLTKGKSSFIDGIVEVGINNPRMNELRAEEMVTAFRKYANEAHPSRGLSRERFLEKFGGAGITTAQFNRAWESSQKFLQGMVEKMYPSPIFLVDPNGDLPSIMNKMRNAAEQLINADVKVKFPDLAKFQEAVQAISRMDDTHLKEMFGDKNDTYEDIVAVDDADGKKFRKEMEGKLEKIEQAQQKNKETFSYGESVITGIQKNILGIRVEGKKLRAEGLKKAETLGDAGKTLVQQLTKNFNQLTSLVRIANISTTDVIEKRLQFIDIQDAVERVEQAVKNIDAAVLAVKTSKVTPTSPAAAAKKAPTAASAKPAEPTINAAGLRMPPGSNKSPTTTASTLKQEPTQKRTPPPVPDKSTKPTKINLTGAAMPKANVSSLDAITATALKRSSYDSGKLATLIKQKVALPPAPDITKPMTATPLETLNVAAAPVLPPSTPPPPPPPTIPSPADVVAKAAASAAHTVNKPRTVSVSPPSTPPPPPASSEDDKCKILKTEIEVIKNKLDTKGNHTPLDDNKMVELGKRLKSTENNPDQDNPDNYKIILAKYKEILDRQEKQQSSLPTSSDKAGDALRDILKSLESNDSSPSADAKSSESEPPSPRGHSPK